MKSNKKSSHVDKQREFNCVIRDLHQIDTACTALNVMVTDMQDAIDQLEATQFGLLLAAERLLSECHCKADPDTIKYLARLRFCIAE